MAKYLCYGYTCFCAERVTAFHLPVNQQVNNPPAGKFARCKNGHERKILTEQIPQLGHWTESDNESAN
jgi:hypothetical protein